MDDELRKEALRRAAIKANHGKTVVIPSVAPIYPYAIEREYRKLADDYIRCVKTVFTENFGTVKAAAKARTDDDRTEKDLTATIRMAFDEMNIALQALLDNFGLRRKLIRIARRIYNHSVEDFVRMLRSVSIDITKDMFLGDFFSHALEEWVDRNVSMISVLPQKTLSAMRKTCLDGYLNGKSITTITKEIQHQYKTVGKNHARLIARDQTSKLSGQVNRSHQEAAGIKEYIWICCMDGRQRKDHENLHGTRHSWDDPPIADTRTGARAHPQEYFQCRCRAEPVIDLSVLDL